MMVGYKLTQNLHYVGPRSCAPSMTKIHDLYFLMIRVDDHTLKIQFSREN